MTDKEARRPLASRETVWAHAITRRLAATSITPNQISAASMVAAAIAAIAFWCAGQTDGVFRALCLFLAAGFCQLRLLCNLLDGMVAVEAGKSTPDGVFWNEFPDRIADIVILVGAGYGVGEPVLGWAAAVFAVLTAYVREMGRTSGMPADFSGPMAKPHRMALITFGTVLSIIEPLWAGRDGVLTIALWLVAVGALITAMRRAIRLVAYLRAAR